MPKGNQEILAFTESAYYYIQNYNMKPESDVKDFEAELKRIIIFVWNVGMSIW